MNSKPYIFYGIELSLYAGKVRSYLRKKKLPFLERGTEHPGFAKATAKLGKSVQPLIETPEGEIIQDTTEIIDFLEQRHPESSVYPEGPCQHLVALLLELFGDEGLTRPAMHYRWNFPEHNDEFLLPQFARGISQSTLGQEDDNKTPSPDDIANMIQQFMRQHTIPALGVTATSIPAIESGYEELLDQLQLHFNEQPYLLGGKPSIGDFGMLAPLYAHLGRDPYPSGLMKRRAPSCYRWVERMNIADSGMAEFPDTTEAFLPNDEVPATIVPILQLMAQDYLPELLSLVASVDHWLTEHPEITTGTPVPASQDGMGTAQPLGAHRFAIRGIEIDVAMRHYSLWMLSRVQDYYDQLEANDRANADNLLLKTGLTPLINARASRRIVRRDYTEIFD